MAVLNLPMVSLNNSLFALFGLEIEIWQIAIIGVLVVALIACIIVAAARSGKKRKVRIRKYIENEEKAISLRKRLRAVNEDISRIKFDYVSKKNALNAQLKKINDDYRFEHGRDDSELLADSDKLLKTNEKLRDLSLRLKKKGLKPDDEKALKAELADTEADHDELSEKIVAMREAKTTRDAELKNKTDAVEKELAIRKEHYDADIAEKNAEKKKIEDELEKLASSQVKISVKDAEAILEEFRAADDADREIRLSQAKEDVERAKNEYLDAVELRAQFERERADAVTSAKEDTKRKLALEKAQAETEAKVGYIITETAQTAQPDQTAQLLAEKTAEEITEEKAETTEEVAEEKVATQEVAEEKIATEETVEPAEETTEPANEVVAEEKTEESNEIAENETIAEETAEETITNETAADENDTTEALENLEAAINEEDKKLSEEVTEGVEEAEKVAEITETETEAAETAETAETTEEETAERAEATEKEIAKTEETAATETIEPINETVEETTESVEEPIIEDMPEEVTETVETEPADDEKIIRIPRDIYNDGIPATPIHKKSKYAKPVTKLLVKKPVVKEEPEQNVQTKEEARKSAYLGKWKVEKTEDGKLFAKLRASNGGILLTTPLYTSEIGLKNGITAIKKSLAADNVTVTANKAGKFVFKITAPSGRTIVTSEQYAAKFQCEKALDSAKRFAETAVITE